MTVEPDGVLLFTTLNGWFQAGFVYTFAQFVEGYRNALADLHVNSGGLIIAFGVVRVYTTHVSLNTLIIRSKNTIMKKVISLCAITMLGVSAICQDTTLQKRTTGDTIPGSNNMQADTSKWNSNSRKDSLGQGNMNSNNQNATWPKGNDTIPGGQSNSLDTSRQQQPMEGSRDSLNRGLTTNNSSDTLNGNQSSNNSGMNRTDSSTTNNNSTTTTTTGNNSSNSNSSADSTTTTTEKVSDRIAMADDKIYMIKNGDSTILSKEYKLSSGAAIMPDGTVKYPTGKSVNLKNGQFIELPKKSESADTDSGTKPAKKTTPAKKKTTKKPTTNKKTTSGSQNQ